MAVSAVQPFTSNTCSPLCRIGCDGSREGSQTDASQRLTDAGGSAGASQRGSCSRSGRLASSPNVSLDNEPTLIPGFLFHRDQLTLLLRLL